MKRAFFGAVFLMLLVIGAKLSGWTPGTLLFGPQYDGSPGSVVGPIWGSLLDRDSSETGTATQARAPQGRAAPVDSPSPIETLKGGWWIKKYGRLNERIDSEYDGTLFFNFASGRDGSGTTTIKLSRLENRGLDVIVAMPPQTFGGSPEDQHVRMELRDHDLDGIPEDARFVGVDMRSAQAPGAQFTPDGYVLLREDPEYDMFYFQWSIAIAVATNRVLYGQTTIEPPSGQPSE